MKMQAWRGTVALLATLGSTRTLCKNDNKEALRGTSRKLGLTAGTETNTYALTETGCFAPFAEGGWGYCGPESCRNNYATCESAGGGPKTVDGISGSWNSGYPSGSGCATFLDNGNIDITDWSPQGPCDSSCTQSSNAVCNSEFLANVLKGSGVKYAYCNDNWLVISASGVAGGLYTENLNDVPYPPAYASDTTLRTGMATLDSSRRQALYYPLNPTALGTSTGENNIGVYDVQSGSGAKSFLIDGSSNYGLPSDGGTGMAVNGKPIFPVYNNNAEYTPQKCEVSSCNEHVGQGGGAAHYHGDPYADDWDCLYGQKNYTSIDAHPPLIGFSYDGYLIYGRYLSESAPGYNSPGLDDCGGHGHDNSSNIDDNGISLSDYHYHTQIFDGVADSSAVADTGDSFVVSTTGPFRCWKGDIAAGSGSGALGSSALLEATADVGSEATYLDKSDMRYRCCGMTDYYMITGLDFPDTSNSYDSSSICTSPTTIDNGSYGSECTGTMLSGYTCTPTCNDGFSLTGMTICIGGTLTEATCVAGSSAPTTAPTTTVSTSVPTVAPTSASEWTLFEYDIYVGVGLGSLILLLCVARAYFGVSTGKPKEKMVGVGGGSMQMARVP